MNPKENSPKIAALEQAIKNFSNENSIGNTYIFIEQLLKFNFFSKEEISFATIEELLDKNINKA